MVKQFSKTIALVAALFFSQVILAQVSIIPRPAEALVTSPDGSFALSPQTTIVMGDASLQPSVDFFNNYLRTQYGFSLKTSRKSLGKNVIFLNVEKTAARPGEGYSLEVNRESVHVAGGDGSGVFYGMQSLVQLLPVEKSPVLHIPLVRISDAPRFSYRGMHLDVGRHFFPVSFIKKFIDYLALHKLNYFHWHLTDDQGWRIEIKKYPRLTTIGSRRNGTITGHYPGDGNDNQPYGGYYTQEEIRDVVAYAAKRYITVVPEIEMPGHSSAAIAAYPWLSCFPDKPTNPKKSAVAAGGYQAIKKVQETWGVFEDVYCAGRDSTFLFLQDVLDEVLVLFPSRYIHIGGDESPKTHWKACSSCQARIKKEGLKDEHELQSYFIQRIEKYLNVKGRTIIGWDEILEGGLAPNAIVMSWRGEKGGIEAAKQKHEVIMTPNAHLYFDQYQARPPEEPLAIGGYNPVSKVYAYEPAPVELNGEERTYIKGVQANLWTEYIKTPEHAEYMVMPRMAALAEVAWSQPEKKDWPDFSKRMMVQLTRYKALGINFSKAVYDVQQTIVVESVLNRATVTLTTESAGTQIRYTLDGCEPTSGSEVYRQSFVLKKSGAIKAATFYNGTKQGRTSKQEILIMTNKQ